MKPVKIPDAKPETINQARGWDKRKTLYLSTGLCEPCASRVSWGHQLGFSKISGPCENCQPIVDTYPHERAGGWRTVQTWPFPGQQSPLSSPLSVGGTPGYPPAQEPSEGAFP